MQRLEEFVKSDAEKTLVVACRGGAVSRDAAYLSSRSKGVAGKKEESEPIRKQLESATGVFFDADREQAL